MRIFNDLITIKNWVQKEGLTALPDIAYGFYASYLWGRAGDLMTRGQNVYDKEWDVLIILDACRYDMFERIGQKYDHVSNIDGIWSVGANSEEWMENTFDQEYRSEISNTAYVTANPFSDKVLDDTEFLLLDEIWKQEWDDQGTVLPQKVTHHAISVYRNHEPNHMIVHYMQPHVPFLEWKEASKLNLDNFGGARADRGDDTWVRLRKGDLNEKEVRRAYDRNLEIVMDNLEVLLNNLDSENTVISADHGNAMGEFGIYGHPRGVPLEAVRRVPWAKVDSRDEKTHNPDVDIGRERTIDLDAESRLEDLGYK